MKPIIKKVNNLSREKEEKTAYNILMALRRRFAKEENDPRDYDSKELYMMLKDIMRNMNSKKLNDFIKESRLDGTLTLFGNEVVDKAIKSSKIRRFPWKQILGITLTEAIHKYRNRGMNQEKTFLELRKNENIIRFIKDNQNFKDKIINNLEISVHSRFGEMESAERRKNFQKKENRRKPEDS